MARLTGIIFINNVDFFLQHATILLYGSQMGSENNQKKRKG
jgi:hypothetical protein